MEMESKTHFGNQTVNLNEKQGLVDDVFHSVANEYDLMNDLMSFGIHRLWKSYTIQKMHLNPNDLVLDLAGGTGDMSLGIIKYLKTSNQLTLSDYNISMLEIGRKNLRNHGYLSPIVALDGHHLPFVENHFDHIVVAFGLRNMANIPKVFQSANHVLKKGGKLTVLEFTTPPNQFFKSVYDWYSFNIIPQVGDWITRSKESYQYLVESIRKHPKAPELQEMMKNAAFIHTEFEYLTQGIVAIHRGTKI